MTECLPIVPTDVAVAVVPGEPSSFSFLSKNLRIGYNKDPIALVGLAGNRFPSEALKVVDDVFVEEYDH